MAGLILSGNTLFGTTSSGGTSSNGTVFSVSTSGTGFRTLHSFSGSDGVQPVASLNLSGSMLYGTTMKGGAWGWGTIFAVAIDGSSFTTLHSFNGTNGAYPVATMLLSSNTLYGTSSGNGGPPSYGTVFSFLLGASPPGLAIAPSGSNVVLKWPATGTFLLQSTTNLAGTVWTTVSSAPVTINGHNIVTNPISRSQEFFRLSP